MENTPTVHRVALVACGATKLDHAAPARDLYVSQLFAKASAYAAATADEWFILSAMHGLVHPDTVLEPYDARLDRNPRTPANAAWADGVRGQLATALAGRSGVVLVALAGESYRAALHPCAWPYEIPMAGLGIGQQLGFLTTALAGLGNAPVTKSVPQLAGA